ncbi:BsuBI/PstI family type II restriction endonuclease [Sulfurimonas sp.]|uniref:BsuBI/PstI family type II restriction endonuclease n=1 Tax=Sulfurimonas sp. TaxID=2022749 RepID=UPI001A07B2B4|nr:BsuBI/PstI family type II restriction endonuclease [Sulfurimonas sp.]MBE0513917.1 restriction endonuclease [Sulfurimonas sp.]
MVEQNVDLLIAKKLEDAGKILSALELPKPQQNDRSQRVFLALANIKPADIWEKVSAPLLTTHQIMKFIEKEYKHKYATNSRESIRKETLHQFEQAGLIERNRDDAARATNSSKNNYSLNRSVINILHAYPHGKWKLKVQEHLDEVPSLIEQYSKKIHKTKIPVVLPSGKEITLSPGKHNELHADIVHEFCPRFIGKSGVVLYIGDTASSREEGGKFLHLEDDYLLKLGVPPMSHDKLPDVVVYDKDKKWLFLIEAVTSRGPVSPKRWLELEDALKECKVGRVYVTAFPDQKEFRKHAADIAWETEVWIADNPDHMIHFNGDRFLGPH